MLTANTDVLSNGAADVGKTDLVEHTIPAEPEMVRIRQLPRKVGLEKDKEQVRNLARQGLEEPGSRAWSSPVILV